MAVKLFNPNHFSRDSPASGYDDICIAEWLQSILHIA